MFTPRCSPKTAGVICAVAFLAAVVISCNQKLPGSEPLKEIAEQESTLTVQPGETDTTNIDLSKVVALDPQASYAVGADAQGKGAELVALSVTGTAKQAMCACALPGKRMTRTAQVDVPWTASGLGHEGDSVIVSARSVGGPGAGTVIAAVATAPITASQAGTFETARKQYLASRDSLNLVVPSGVAAARRNEIERAYKLAEHKFEQDLAPLGSATGYGNQLALVVEALK